MMPTICGARAVREGRKMICRRRPNHEGDHAWQTAVAKKMKQPLSLAARTSDLIRSLPEGDYTDQVTKVYINHRTVLIEFGTSDFKHLIERRKHG